MASNLLISAWEMVKIWTIYFFIVHTVRSYGILFSKSLVYLGTFNVLEDNVFHMLCGHPFKRKAKKLWASAVNSILWYFMQEYTSKIFNEQAKNWREYFTI